MVNEIISGLIFCIITIILIPIILVILFGYFDTEIGVGDGKGISVVESYKK